MSFFTINGFPLPVASGSWRKGRQLLGKRDRSFGGELGPDSRPFKRSFSGRTSPLLPDDAKLIRCLLGGQFDTISFDGTFNSGKGVVPSAGAGMFEPSVAADGTLSSYGPVARAYGQALWGQPAVTNLLTANQSSVETDTTGFSGYYGGSLSKSSDRAWVGSSSLKVVCGTGGNPDGLSMTCPATGCSGAGQYFTFSVYVTGTGTVCVYLYNATRGRSATKTLTLSPDRWTRGCVSVTADASTDSFQCNVYQNPFNQGITFYADGFSLVKSDTPVPWCIGGTSSTGLTVPTYATAQMLSDEFTILGITHVPVNAAANYAGRREVFEFNSGSLYDALHSLVLQRNSNAITFSASLTSFNTNYPVGTSPAQTAGTWIPWAVSYSPQSTATRDKLQFFIGVGTGSSFMHTNTANVVPASVLAKLYVNCATLIVDDLLILHTAITQAQYQAIAASWDALLPAPQLRVKGDAVAAELAYPSADAVSLAMRGKVNGDSIIQAYSGGTWHNDLSVIDFELSEV